MLLLELVENARARILEKNLIEEVESQRVDCSSEAPSGEP